MYRHSDRSNSLRVDFVNRRHFKKSIILLIVMIIISATSLVSYIIMDLKECLIFGFLSLLSISTFLLCFYANLLKRTEFQNMLFANTTRTFCEFFVIFNQCGQIIFIDQCITQLIKTKPKNIYSLIPKSQHEQLKLAINYSVSKQLPFNEEIDFIISPLPRPKNHFSLIAQRKSIEEVYKNALQKHEIGYYIKNHENQIIEANQALLSMTNLNSSEQLNSKNINKFKINSLDGSKIDVRTTTIGFKKINKNYTINLVTPLNFVSNEFLNSPIPIVYSDLKGKNLAQNQSFEKIIGKNVNIRDILSQEELSNDNINRNITFDQLDLEITVIKRNNILSCYLVDITPKQEIQERMHHFDRVNSLGKLAGVIAHDFNNILTVILSFCENLIETNNPGTESFYSIMQIKENGERASRLVQQILAFSSKQKLDPSPQDLNNIIDGVLGFIKRIASDKIELTINYEHDPWLVNVDKTQVEQVIMNLAVNAKNAIQDKGKISITTQNISIKNQNDFKFKIPKGEYILLKTQDNGMGIPNNLLKNIFEPFFSTHNSSGLGLSTVKGIILQSKGWIFIDSKVGLGTTFYILFPRIYSQEQHINTQTQDINKIHYTTINHTKNILLVEDEQSIRSLTKKTLMKQGYIVTEAKSGCEALNIAKKNLEIDVLITDIMMPGISGLEAADEILKIKPKIQVIFISGYSKESTNFNPNFDYTFLRKPFVMKDMIKAVQTKNIKNTN